MHTDGTLHVKGCKGHKGAQRDTKGMHTDGTLHVKGCKGLKGAKRNTKGHKGNAHRRKFRFETDRQTDTQTEDKCTC